MSKREKCRGLRSIWFTDEKTLTLATPANSQNDRVFSDARKKHKFPAKRLVRDREHFSGGIVVSVGVSRMGKTSVMFVESGAKVNSDY